MPGLSSEQKKAKLARMSYADYLTKLVKVDPQVVTMLDPEQKSLYGVGIDAVSAQDAWGLDMPGFDGLKLAPGAGPGMGRDAIPNEEAEKYFFHFPDGNSSIARLLVRSLIPEAVPGNSADDIVTSQVRYDQLDQPGKPTRIRLNSTVVRVRHDGDPSTAKEVEVTYVQQGRLYTVKAAHCILACWHPVIPYLTSELPAPQMAALRSAEKVPIVYTNVALRNWESFVRLQTRSVTAPGCYFTEFGLDHRVSIGDYHCTKRPEDPIVLTMERYPCSAGIAGAQPASCRTRRSLCDLIRDVREKHPGAACPQPRRRRIRSRARHRRHHGQSLAARIRLSIQLAVGSVLVGRRPPALRRGTQTVWAHRHRQCRCRRIRLHRLCHQPGLPGGERSEDYGELIETHADEHPS